MNAKMTVLACLLFGTLLSAAPSSFPADYITFAEMEGELKAISQTHPNIAMLQSIGKSVEGRPIYALKISDFPQNEEDEPDVLYVSEHHARESITVVIAMEWVRYLLNNYEKDFTIKELVDSREIWVVPMMNPDGHVRVENGDASWRANARGVDLNRNYDYKWGYDNIGSSPVVGESTYRGEAPFSEPETKAIESLVDSHNFVTAISYHSGTNLTLYPWRYIAKHTPHNDLFRAIGETIEDIAGYHYGDSEDGVIYTSNGSFNDWAYAKGIMAITIEVYGKNSSDVWEYFNPPSFDIVPKNIKAAQFMADIADEPQRAFIRFSFEDRFKTSMSGETAEFEGIVKNNYPQTQTFVMEGPPDFAFSQKSFKLSPHEIKSIVVSVKSGTGRKISEIGIYSATNPGIRNAVRLIVEGGREVPFQLTNMSVESQSDSVRILCETTTETVATLLYGTKVLDTKMESNVFGHKHSFVLRNLEPGKKYSYKIVAKDASGSMKESDVSSFITEEPMIPRTQIAKQEGKSEQVKIKQLKEYLIILLIIFLILGVLVFIIIKTFKR